jgi:hypothetical protein
LWGSILTEERLFVSSIPDVTNGLSTLSGMGPELKALTQISPVTIAVLAINDPEFVDVRRASQD